MERIIVDKELYNKLAKGAVSTSRNKTIWQKSAKEILSLSRSI
jgi:hypothetical protein